MHLPPEIQHGVLFTGICDRLSSVLVSYRATREKVDQLANDLPRLDEGLPVEYHRERMKEIAGARFSLLHYIQEMTIIAIAKTFEDLAFDLRDIANYLFDFWNPDFSLPHYHELSCLRNLNNSIKHSRGVIIDDDHPSNRSLIDDCGYAAGIEIRYIDLDFEALIAKAFFCQNELIEQVTGVTIEIPIPDSDEERIRYTDNLLYPDALR